ncbi:hypothetical protein G9P44_002839 [Scheffersomyces stipitis]|nr:hypothetical protein G9P44_002839 [Scheffersomyces stipitis]
MSSSQDSATKFKRRATVSSLYTNYQIANGAVLPEITLQDGKDNVDSEQFFNEYIRLRKPVKLVSGSGSTQTPVDLKAFDPSRILDTLDYSDELQIERKINDGFGSGEKRVKMTLHKLLDVFKQGNSDYYLTTQYDFDDPDFEDSYSEKREGERNQEDDEKENKDSGELEDDIDEEEEEEDEEEEHEDDEDDEDEDDEDEDLPKITFNASFSDTSSVDSIDMNNLRDDFLDSEDDQEPVIDEDLNINQSEYEQRLKDLLQPPLTKLVNKPQTLPIIPELFSTLIPQQINLWMGHAKSGQASKIQLNPQDPKTYGLGKSIPGSRNGTSSGLHHDHADNLYILVSGIKRFTLFSPADALKLYTVGTIYKIYNSGIIDYENNEFAPEWKHIRDDGAMVEDVLNWRLKCDQSDSTEIKSIEKQLQSLSKQSALKLNNKDEKEDPPNFSRIPPALLHIEEFTDPEMRKKLTAFANEKFPGFLDLNSFTVWLNPGEMLYLPAGWFHEVSSFGGDDISQSESGLHNIHIALNYWFVPPNGDSASQCYNDTYWQEDWKRTETCIAHALQK